MWQTDMWSLERICFGSKKILREALFLVSNCIQLNSMVRSECSAKKCLKHAFIQNAQVWILFSILSTHIKCWRNCIHDTQPAIDWHTLVLNGYEFYLEHDNCHKLPFVWLLQTISNVLQVLGLGIGKAPLRRCLRGRVGLESHKQSKTLWKFIRFQTKKGHSIQLNHTIHFNGVSFYMKFIEWDNIEKNPIQSVRQRISTCVKSVNTCYEVCVHRCR